MRKLVVLLICLFLWSVPLSNLAIAEEETTGWPYVNVSDESFLENLLAGKNLRNGAGVEIDGLNKRDLLVTGDDNGLYGFNGFSTLAIVSLPINDVPRFNWNLGDWWDDDNAPDDHTCGIVFADYDNDGDLDFYAPNHSGHHLFEWDESQSKFKEVTTAMGLNETGPGYPDHTNSINGVWG